MQTLQQSKKWNSEPHVFRAREMNVSKMYTEIINTQATVNGKKS